MDLDVEAGVRAGIQLLDAHPLQLAVDRLNLLPVTPQVELVRNAARARRG